jgi:hypothetical protein
MRSVRWGRVARISAITVLVLFVVWVIGGVFVLVRPHVNHPQHSDAIVLLGPPDVNGRLEAARGLLDQHVADTLVISLNSPKQWRARELCAHPPAGTHVSCFHAVPATTRGEAEEIRRLARQHGWKSITIVTSTYHISRARMIVKRCFNGRLDMVAAHKGISLWSWPYQYAYQSAGYLKAFLQPGC